MCTYNNRSQLKKVSRWNRDSRLSVCRFGDCYQSRQPDGGQGWQPGIEFVNRHL